MDRRFRRTWGTLSVVAGLLCGVTWPTAVHGEILPIRERIAPPPGYTRVAAPEGSFGAWLRELPVRPGTSVIRRFDGVPVPNQDHHYVVLDLDIGSTDLQQCADVVMRLRAEYLLAAGCEDDVRFDFTSGDTAAWAEWRRGMRPVVRENGVGWRATGVVDDGMESFRRYLETVFMYAGSLSLSRELLPVGDPKRPEIGDVFILGGTPGHAMLVADVAENRSGERVFMLLQGLMPAQDIHILEGENGLGPWIRARAEGFLEIESLQRMYLRLRDDGSVGSGTSWTFRFSDLKRFAPTECDGASR